ncbi:hypothetical protein LguiB_002202 [Lonicera macranthoides]
MEKEGCLGTNIGVLIFGHTDKARENVAFMLFYLCEIHDYKRIMGGKHGVISALKSCSQPNEGPESMKFYGISYSIESSRVYKPATRLQRTELLKEGTVSGKMISV